MATLAAHEVNPHRHPNDSDYRAAPVLRVEHEESPFTRLLEQQTAKVPSDMFLFLALGSMGLSLFFELANNRRLSRFIGMWPPALLIMGMYNKLVKIAGPR
jgi:hypothetical protein